MKFLPCKSPLPATPPGNRKSILRLLTLALLCGVLHSAYHVSAAEGTLLRTFNLPATKMVADPVRPRIYATITGSDCVAVIDTSSLALITTIPVGDTPIGLAESADGSLLYVANQGSASEAVSVVDLNLLETTGTLAAPQPPYDIAVGLNGWLYLTLGTVVARVPGLMQISTSGVVTGSYLSNEVDTGAALLAISPDRKTLYYGDRNSDPANLASFDVSSGSGVALQSAPFDSVGSYGNDLEISHSGNFLGFAAPGQAGTNPYEIAEIPTANLSAKNGYFNTGSPVDIAFSPDDTFAYSEPLNGTGAGVIKIFNTKSFAETGSFAGPVTAGHMIVDNTGRYLFVAGTDMDDEFYSTNIYVYSTGRVAASITSAHPVVNAALGWPFSYRITANNAPKAFNAIGLPAEFSFDAATGVISGMPITLGTSAVVISASNGESFANATILLTVGDGLDVTVNGKGAVSEGLLGATYHPSGSSVSIQAIPGAGYYFAGWTGDITSGSNPLDFTLSSSIRIQANFDLFATYNGTYYQILSSGTHSGFVSIIEDGVSTFSGSVVLDGIEYSLKGLFPTEGATTSTTGTSPKGSPVTVDLSLDLSGMVPTLTGSASSGAFSQPLVMPQLPFYTPHNLSARRGSYTLAFHASQTNQSAPAGTGYATMTVSALGAARLVGRLADGTAFSGAATVQPDGTLLLYVPLYNKKGELWGPLVFESATSTGLVDGTANWIKPVTTSRTFPSAFSTALSVAGSSYSSRVPAFVGAGGTLSFAGTGLSTPISQPFTINARGNVVITSPNLNSVTFSLNRASGTFSGAFREARTRYVYRGVVLQGQDAGAGVFVDAAASGTATLTVTP